MTSKDSRLPSVHPSRHRQDRVHLFQSIPPPVPLDLKSVAVVDDVPEATEWAELAGQPVAEQRRQRRLSGRVEPLEQVQVPVFTGGQRQDPVGRGD